ncbi:CocE/NonD family hydrolase [Alloalcanivorax profundimaris]|uniref:CocE/NonD family hydrolase n=1 Tax=Alloalcanivorax profundimaris TaxID=2735259 RepID=UPI0018873F8F|nr:CocE/NonD family hydrolase [Alloalcanivorax profundimaris]MBF1801120.1 CocE/NonD family hydrolase [Alloalcanivorax profundimaris]
MLLIRPAHRRLPLFFLLASLLLALAACGGGGDSASGGGTASETPNAGGNDGGGGPAPQPEPEPEPEPEPVNLDWDTPYDRPEEYPNTVTLPQQLITLRDGIRLSASVTLPADEDGNPAPGPFPVVATFTGYNQALGLIGAADPYLVKRGYAYIIADLRGTGASEGTWQAFGETDHEDIGELLDYIDAQPWSNGTLGMNGASYMGITGLLAGAQRPAGVDAIFAIVPMGDAYRDIVFQGGQINAGFIPLWVALVTGLGLVPTPVGLDNDQPLYYLETLLDHLTGTLTEFPVPVVAGAVLGDEHKYNTDFWRQRSPLEQADRIQAPTFVVGGLRDIFQRGEPLIYEALKNNGTDSKLLIGPWEHLDGSGGAGLPADGVPALANIRLAWFDHYLKGMDTGAERFPPVTQYYTGDERYRTAADWPHPEARAEAFYLHGQPGLPLFGGLNRKAPGPDGAQTSLLQTPLNGLCSASASQWTAGVLGLITPPCSEQNNLSELLEAVYTSEPLEEDMVINGPIGGQIWASTTGLDTNVVVRVSVVDPNGLSRELTNGIQMASMSGFNPQRSRFMNGKLVQPWHPFTARSGQEIRPLEPFRADVEVFPTSAVIPAGHRLRVSVGASDLPHGLSPIPDLLRGLLGALTVYSTPAMPSRVNIPLVPTDAVR